MQIDDKSTINYTGDILRKRYHTIVSHIMESKQSDTLPNTSEYTPLMQECYECLINKGAGFEASSPQVQALKIFTTPFKRLIIESLLLSGALVTDIEQIFGVSQEILDVYTHLYFDVTLLHTHLDKLSYVEMLPDGSEKELKLRALNLGPEFIYFRYANIVPKTEDMKEVMKRMFFGAAYRVMEANYNSIESGVSKAALQWAQAMNKCFDSLNRLTDNNPSATQEGLMKILVQNDMNSFGADLTPRINRDDKRTGAKVTKSSLV